MNNTLIASSLLGLLFFFSHKEESIGAEVLTGG